MRLQNCDGLENLLSIASLHKKEPSCKRRGPLCHPFWGYGGNTSRDIIRGRIDSVLIKTVVHFKMT